MSGFLKREEGKVVVWPVGERGVLLRKWTPAVAAIAETATAAPRRANSCKNRSSRINSNKHIYSPL